MSKKTKAERVEARATKTRLDPQIVAQIEKDTKAIVAQGVTEAEIGHERQFQQSVEEGWGIEGKAIVVKKPKPAPKPVVVRPTCPETKKNGEACTAKCMEGKGTCVDHQPAWDRLTHEEHVAFGEWLRRARGPEIVDVIGWWKAKQIAHDHRTENPKDSPATTEQVK